MKKFWVLFSLFVLPLVFYIFLSKGIYKYSNLPILTEQVLNVESEQVTFYENLSVVCFLGSDINTAKASMFNLNQTIYKRYYQKPLFQVIAILPEGSEQDYKNSIEELSAFTDIVKWNFVYKPEQDIKNIAKALTGYRVDFNKQELVFKKRQHDSSFVKIFNSSGSYSIDGVLKLILSHPMTAKFITEKFWREFISDKPDEKEIERISIIFRNSGRPVNKSSLRRTSTCARPNSLK